MRRVRVFKTKPVSVTALQWDGSNESFHSIMVWCGNAIIEGVIRQELLLTTIEGIKTVHLNDWILKGKGGFFCCTPEVLSLKYREVKSDND